MEKQRDKISKYELVLGEDTYASQTAQNPATARKLLSWIVSDVGDLEREWGQPKYAPTQLSGPVMALFEYDWYDTAGNTNRTYFAAAATDSNPGTITCNLYILTAGVWVLINTAPWTTLANTPAFAVINNTLHMSDGVGSWIYDTTAWVIEGMPIPAGALEGPNISVGGGTGISAVVGRFYWTTWADQTATRPHESSTSPISTNNAAGTQGGGTGPLANKNVNVFQTSGTITILVGTPTIVTGVNTHFLQFKVGMKLYTAGVSQGTIASIQSDTQLTLAAGATLAVAGVRFVIAPPRATHWNIYCSEVDGSKIGQYLTSVPVTTVTYVDNSPFFTQTGTIILSIQRPVRNDPPPGSLLLAVHKYRLWRRRDSGGSWATANAHPNFFNFSANEEVLAFDNGTPSECVPGADPSTQSDLINENAYPDSSHKIRAMISHADALYMFSEVNGIPLWGESLDDFSLSQVTAFAQGCAGRFALASTPHGLAFMSYDRKLYLYPTSNYPWAYVPENVQVTDQLIEIGKSMRKKFENIKFTNLDQVRLTYYGFGRRNWLVVAYPSNDGTYSTYVYDFTTKGWFQLQRGFTSLAVFEVSQGVKVLLGGGTDGFVYVVDDLTGTYVASGNYPAASYRTALLDFGDPDSAHVLQYIEFELTNTTLAKDISINFWLDPADVDNPGAARTVPLEQVVRGAANVYRGFFRNGSFCQRALLEIACAASVNNGAIRGLKLVADKASGLARR